MEYHGNLDIALIIRLDICYKSCSLVNQNVEPTLLFYKASSAVFNILIVEPYFIHITIMMDQMPLGLHGVGIKLKTT